MNISLINKRITDAVIEITSWHLNDFQENILFKSKMKERCTTEI